MIEFERLNGCVQKGLFVFGQGLFEFSDGCPKADEGITAGGIAVASSFEVFLRNFLHGEIAF